MLWQRGLVEREINELLRVERNQSKKFVEDEINADSEVEQRSIGENDVCSICQEEFLIKKLPITYCRFVRKANRVLSFFLLYIQILV